MKSLPFSLLLLIATYVFPQMYRPTSFEILSADTVYEGLIGSSISDISGQGNTLWLGTGYGLSATFDGGQSFIGFSTRYSALGKGGVSALAVAGDTIWVAMGFDSSTVNGNEQTGGGISRSTDGGQTWTFLGQPMDSLRYIDGSSIAETYSPMYLWGDTILAVDVVTPISNITFDLAWDGKNLWAASFAGGLRVSHDMGNKWERVLLPWDNTDILDSLTFARSKDEIDALPEYYALDPLTHLNHRVFSVIATGDTVWAGTAGGVNFSSDGGQSWRRYHFQNSNITGNWVIALHRQILSDGSDIIWASTITTNESDDTGISFFLVGDDYWRAPLLDNHAWNFATDRQNIYVATDNGLLKSKDGLHFTLLPPFSHADNSEIIYSNAVYSVFVNEDGSVWVGTGDGLAVSYDDGVTWQITKARYTSEEEEFFSYPNPFTPRYDNVLNGQGHLIIRFAADTGSEVSLSVFDFTMHKVKDIVDSEIISSPGSHERVWTGRNTAGYLVSNGTYFIRLTLDQDVRWTKVMVIN